MQLVKVPWTLVADDVATTKPAVQDSSFPSSRSQRFCTGHHAPSEITSVVTESESFKHHHGQLTATHSGTPSSQNPNG
jgi:hypothetical protein